MKPSLITRHCALGLPLLLIPACITDDSDILDVGDGCEELVSGNYQAIDDARVRALVDAAVDFDNASDAMRDAVLDACAGIAVDLGAEDSWSALDDPNERITNGARTGACDVAKRAIALVMDGAAAANVSIALAISTGACYPDFEAQAACEAGCAANTTCTPGTVEERCEPGSLSVTCEAACSAEGHCEGTPELPANCMGMCESTCQGECKGTCIAPDGSITENDPNCMGKCSSGCNGLCRGLCKIEAPEGVECGAGVSCRGGCTGSYTEPKCVTEFTPPSCTIDEECYASCAAEATVHAVCEPPHVEVYVDVDAMADGKLAVLVETLETHLPDLIWAAETQGELALRSIERLTASAELVAEDVGDLDGESLACAVAVAELTFEASVRIQASVTGSVAVVDTCNDRAQ